MGAWYCAAANELAALCLSQQEVPNVTNQHVHQYTGRGGEQPNVSIVGTQSQNLYIIYVTCHIKSSSRGGLSFLALAASDMTIVSIHSV